MSLLKRLGAYNDGKLGLKESNVKKMEEKYGKNEMLEDEHRAGFFARFSDKIIQP